MSAFKIQHNYSRRRAYLSSTLRVMVRGQAQPALEIVSNDPAATVAEKVTQFEAGRTRLVEARARGDHAVIATLDPLVSAPGA